MKEHILTFSSLGSLPFPMITETPYNSNCAINIPTHFGHYKYLKTIGKGSSAVVVKCLDEQNDRMVACKIVHRNIFHNLDLLTSFERELRILERLHHPNIVQIYEVLYFTDLIIIVMEYCSNGDLHSYIYSQYFISENEIISIATQLLNALSYLHSKGLAHRDIKPENIVFDSNMNLKLIDFGLCKETTSPMQTRCGSPYYIAPEIVQGFMYDGAAADMWSFGLVIYFLATGDLPWKSHNEFHVLKDLSKGIVCIEKKVKGKLVPLVDKTLLLEPKERAKASELLMYLNSFHQSSSLPIMQNGKLNRKKFGLKQIKSVIDNGNNKLIIRKQSNMNMPKQILAQRSSLPLSRHKFTISCDIVQTNPFDIIKKE